MDFPLLKQLNETKLSCEIHKTPLLQLKDKPPFCPTCTKERLDKEEQQRVDDRFMRQHKRKTIEILRKDSIVGDETLWDATFKNYKTENNETELALKIARASAGQYLNTDTPFNTILSGVPGVGKSHLAMSMLKAVNENSKPFKSCLFVSVADLFRLIKDSISNKQSRFTEDNMVRLLCDVDLLVLDDLGSESSFQRITNESNFQHKVNESSEYNQRILFSILNARNRTIITTNLNSDELRAIYNPKIVSRIFKGVEGHIIKFTEKTSDKRTKINF